MLKYNRLIPVLSLIGEDLVNTTQFKNPRYLGDPINAVRIFNEKMADELVIVDIRASLEKTPIQFDLLKRIANQAFMPMSYGGGIRSIEDSRKLFKMGFEKIIINSSFFENPTWTKGIIDYAGSSSVVLSLDIKKNIYGKYSVYSHSGKKKVQTLSNDFVQMVNDYQFGEIILNFIENDGMMNGYATSDIANLNDLFRVPIIPYGGASNIKDIQNLFAVTQVNAAAASSFFVYQGKNKAVLINYPSDISNLIKEEKSY